MFCKNCGKELSAGSKFCSVCGFAVNGNQTSPTVDTDMDVLDAHNQNPINQKKFIDEIKNYSNEDLKLIIETQQDLYTAEEMALMKQFYSERLHAEKEKQAAIRLARLPKTINCEKCDAPNDFSNDVCQYCGNKLRKAKYYDDKYYANDSDLDTDYNEDDDSEDKYVFHKVISFLIPLIGYILGSILLASDNDEKCETGKQCIILAIVSQVIFVVIAVVIIYLIANGQMG